MAFLRFRSKLQSQLDELKDINTELQSQIADIKNQQTTQQINLNDLEGLSEIFGINKAYTGSYVSADSAMNIAAVFGCVRLIGGSISSCDLMTMKRTGDHLQNIQPDIGHKLYRMMRFAPNDFVTAPTFWKFIIQHRLVSGNGYAFINRKGPNTQEIDYIFGVKPTRVAVYMAWQLGFDKKLGVPPFRLFYYVTLDNGHFMVVDQDDMLHFPNLGWDGRRGLSTVTAAAQAFGLALAEEEHGARYFGQGIMSDIALSWPGKISKDTADQVKQTLRERNAGLANAYLPMILAEGAKVEHLSLNAQQAQLIDSRRFSVTDICRFFGVPPVMIGESTKVTSWGSGVEQMAQWFVRFTLNDHFTDIEHELERKLFGDGIHFAKFNELQLLRGDTATRANYLKDALGSVQSPGWMTQNEARDSENMPPASEAEANTLFRPPAPTAAGGLDEKAKPNPGA